MKNKKLIGLSLTLLGLVSMYVGTFAYYMKVVNGTITGKTGSFTFDVLHNSTTFKNIDLYETMENPSLTSKYIIPGDSGKFDLLVDATGTLTGVEYEIDFVGTNIPTNMKFYLDENKTEEVKLEYGLLGYIKSTDETKNKLYTIYWEWPYDSGYNNDDDINYQDKEMTFNVTATGKQSSGFAMMMNDATIYNGGRADAKGMWNQSYQRKIKMIIFSNDINNLPSECKEENLCWDISANSSSYPVYNYLVPNENDSYLYDSYVVSEKEIYAPYDSTNLFSLITTEQGAPVSRVVAIKFNNTFNTSKVRNMSGMFELCTALNEIDLSSFDTSNVINMSNMFLCCGSIKKIDISNFDTSKVKNMSGMFATSSQKLGDYSGSSSLLEIKMGSKFNTTNVTNMNGMFSSNQLLTNINWGSNFNTSKVKDMSKMFSGCTKLATTITIRNANASCEGMFNNAATASSAKITVNYTSETESLVDKMIATKSSNSNVVKGTKQ